MNEARGQRVNDARPPLSLDLFEPRRIAIVGASERPGPASNLQKTLDKTGFTGEVLPVNPNRDQVFGRKAYPSLAAIEGPVDLAIVLVATERVPDVIEEAGANGVRSAIIFSAGFAELGEEGRRAQERISLAARLTGIRVFGPNCIGYANPAEQVVAMVVAPPSVPAGMRVGSAALVSQSGGLMISSLEYASQVGLGFRLLASTGNEADVTCIDVVEALIGAPGVRCIGLIAEGIADGRRLIALAERGLELGKQIVVLKLGRSARGAEAVLTHTAVLAGSGRVFDAVCRDAGIVQAETIADLVEHLVLLEKPPPRNRRPGGVAVMTISGGTKVLIADIATAAGIDLAELAPSTRRQLAQVIPDIGVASNPLDLTGAAIEDAEVLRKCLHILARDPGVGAIALVMHLRKTGGSEGLVNMVRAFCAAQAEVPARLVVSSSIPEGVSGFWREVAATGDVPFLNDLASLKALRALDERPRGPRPPHVKPRARPPAVVARAIAAGEITLAESDARALLETAGIPAVPSILATSADEAIAAAERLGYPVVLKLAARGVIHKTELGGVRLGVATAGHVATAFAQVVEGAVQRQPGLVVEGVLVQPMAGEGVELVAGVSRDPQFGTIVTVGLGGIFAEILDDVVVRLGPLRPAQARAMLLELRGRSLLLGARGRPAVAIDLAARVIADLSRLGAALSPWVESIEVNPLVVGESEVLALDCVAVLSD